jgi:hypothetical protein
MCSIIQADCPKCKKTFMDPDMVICPAAKKAVKVCQDAPVVKAPAGKNQVQCPTCSGRR